MVAEFAITEFAAAIGVSTDAGKRYVGHALELAPGSRGCGAAWSRVTSGHGWPGGSRTRPSSSPGGRVVRGPARGPCGAQDRTRPARTARGRGDRDVHARPRRGTRLAKADGRYFTVEQQQISYAGTAAVHGELDLADALDLEQAVAGLAGQLKELGSEDSLNVRRAAAVGELARNQLALDLRSGG